MIWTLAFVLFLVNGEAKVGGGMFKTKAACEAIRADLFQVRDEGALPDNARSLVVGRCDVWTDPKAGLNP